MGWVTHTPSLPTLRWINVTTRAASATPVAAFGDQREARISDPGGYPPQRWGVGVTKWVPTLYPKAILTYQSNTWNNLIRSRPACRTPRIPPCSRSVQEVPYVKPTINDLPDMPLEAPEKPCDGTSGTPATLPLPDLSEAVTRALRATEEVERERWKDKSVWDIVSENILGPEVILSESKEAREQRSKRIKERMWSVRRGKPRTYDYYTGEPVPGGKQRKHWQTVKWNRRRYKRRLYKERLIVCPRERYKLYLGRWKHQGLSVDITEEEYVAFLSQPQVVDPKWKKIRVERKDCSKGISLENLRIRGSKGYRKTKRRTGTKSYYTWTELSDGEHFKRFVLPYLQKDK